MKTCILRILALAGGLWAAAPLGAQSQFTMPWWTIDGGGGSGATADGRFVLHGTMGQPDAGIAYGTNLALFGGFWGGIHRGLIPPPQILCPSNLVFNADLGQCSKSNVTYTATATDYRGTNLTVTCVPPSGSTFLIGPTPVICTATDAWRNSNSCRFSVTVLDLQPPQVTCPSNIVDVADPGQNSRSNVTYTASANDNCETNLTAVCAPPSGSTFLEGVTTVVCVAADIACNSNSCSFTVTILAPQPPTISDIPNQTTNEDNPIGPVVFTVGDVETPAASLLLSATSTNTTLVPIGNIAFSGSGSTRTVTVTPVANQFGRTLITVTVTDANGGTASASFLVTVNSVNDLPTISDIPDQTTNEDNTIGPVVFTVGDVETPAASLVLSATSTNTTLVPIGNIVFGGSGSTRTVTVTPVAHQLGTTLITVTVTDGEGGTASDEFAVYVLNPPAEWPFFTRLAPPPGASYASLRDIEVVQFGEEPGAIAGRNIDHRAPLPDPVEPPLLGSTTNYLGSNTLYTMEFSIDDGATWLPGSATGAVEVLMRHISDSTNGSTVTEFYDLEMLTRNAEGTSPIGSFLVRESPTQPSLGKHTIRYTAGEGVFYVSSFFDVYLDLSLDGGASWMPADRAVRMMLEPSCETNPPVATNVVCVGSNQVLVAFNEAMDPVTSEEAMNYAVSGGAVVVLDATLQPSGRDVLLTCEGLTAGVPYTLSLADVRDLCGNVILPNPTDFVFNCGPVSVVINEWLANNVDALADPADGDYEPWFELYNIGAVAADLGGYHLAYRCCDPEWTNRTEFIIPTGTVIPAQGFLLVWADAEPNQTTSSNLHVNFRLDPSSGYLSLYSPSGQRIDEVSYGPQEPNYCQGRFPDGAWACLTFGTISPGTRNVPSPIDPVMLRQSLLFLKCRGEKLVNVIPYNLSGESSQDSQPSVAMKPGYGCSPLVISALNESLPHPLFTSTDAGWTWDSNLHEDHYGATVGWGLDGAYLAMKPTPWSLDVRTSPAPEAGTPFTPIAESLYEGGFDSPDQPWVEVSGRQIYVGFNDLSRWPGRTASVHYSLDGGITWNQEPGSGSFYPVVIEPKAPGAGQDGPAIRVVEESCTVYAVFARWNECVPNCDNGSPKDYRGDVVLVRDDNGGLNRFRDQVTVVASDILLPWDRTMLGHQRIGSSLSLAVDHCRVYVAYAQVSHGVPLLRVRLSIDGGETFGDNVFTPHHPAALPALGVAEDHTVGLLYTALNGITLETHLLQTASRDFNEANTQDRVLARFPDNVLPETINPYLGNYQSLKVENNVFYGTFAASNDPEPEHFPMGVFYQRSVLVEGAVQAQYQLIRRGTLTNPASGGDVPVSIDPFYFQISALPPEFTLPWKIEGICRGKCYTHDPSPPPPPLSVQVAGPQLRENTPYIDIRWQINLPPQPQMRLESSTRLEPEAVWTPVSETAVEDAYGCFSVKLPVSGPSRFFRLRLEEPNPDMPYLATAAAGAHGTVFPGGVSTNWGGQSATFTATPDTNYLVDEWYVDGQRVQTGGTSFILTNIQADYFVLAAFTPRYDLAITKVAHFAARNQEANAAAVDSTVLYILIVANNGVEPVTGIQATDILPASVSLMSATASQGTCQLQGGGVVWDLGSLGRHESAQATIEVIATVEGMVTNTATVQGNEAEVDTSNNSSTEVLLVQTPPTIVQQPQSQTIPAGGTATFNVGTLGTPPLNFQWFFNGSPIMGATANPLVLTNVGPTHAGSYLVIAANEAGEVRSDPAILTVP